MNSTTSPILGSRTYEALKYLALIVLPAVGTLYFALSQIWGFPAGEEVVGTIVALEAFLGVALGISTKQYNNSDARFDGRLITEETEGVKSFTLEYDDDPYYLDQKNEVILKVDR